MPDTSLINMKGLTKPATVLIEKISGAIGVVYEPTKARRMAKAKADVALIKAQADIEVTDFQQRAMTRFVEERGLQQKNIESITAKAIPHLDVESDPSGMDEDWIADFFEKSKRVSNEEMQDLWARVLAEEANTPTSVSKRTVDFISTMDRSDADIFSKLCSFAENIWNEPLIFEPSNEIYNNNGIKFIDLTHLDAIGLINFNNASSYQREKIGKNLRIELCRIPTNIEFKNDENNNLVIGHVIFTKTGRDLSKFCKSVAPNEFYHYAVNYLTKRDLNLSSPIR